MPEQTHSLMPDPMDLGQQYNTPLGVALYNYQDKVRENKYGYRTVMGFFLPPWQRGLVWTERQKVKFLESAWMGLSLGTYTVNHSPNAGDRFDRLLIDGQQRMSAIEDYVNDQFPVFGYRWSEVTDVDRRRFENMTMFPSYITRSDNEYYLRSYYDMLNFGGTPHQEHERALRTGDEQEEPRTPRPKF